MLKVKKFQGPTKASKKKNLRFVPDIIYIIPKMQDWFKDSPLKMMSSIQKTQRKKEEKKQLASGKKVEDDGDSGGTPQRCRT